MGNRFTGGVNIGLGRSDLFLQDFRFLIHLGSRGGVVVCRGRRRNLIGRGRVGIVHFIHVRLAIQICKGFFGFLDILVGLRHFLSQLMVFFFFFHFLVNAVTEIVQFLDHFGNLRRIE